MLAILQESFWDRLVGVVTLKRPTFEEIRHDAEAIGQSWWIILLLGLAQGIALITTPLVTVFPGMSEEMASTVAELAAAFTFDTTEKQLLALAASVGGLVLSWRLTSWLLQFIGNRLASRSAGSMTTPEMRRLVAWGYAPSLASFLLPVPVAGPLLALLGWFWSLVTGVMAVRVAFDVGIGKAVAIRIAAFLAALLVMFMVLLVITMLGLVLA